MALTQRATGVFRGAAYKVWGYRDETDAASLAKGELQGFVAVDSTGTPITTFGTPMVTFTPTRPDLPNNASTEIIAENANRKVGSYIMNNTGTVLWGNYGGTAAVMNQGFKILNQQVFLFNTTQAINLIQTSGSLVNPDVFEAT